MKSTRLSATIVLLLFAYQSSQANDRPFESARTAVAEDDDQVWSFESWSRRIGRERSLTIEPEYSFDPANSVQLELTRKSDRQDGGHEVEIEYKHLFNRLARDGWGWGLSAALSIDRSDGRSARALDLRLPLSVDFGQITGLGHGSLLHLNAGLHHASGRFSASRAIAFEQPVFQRSLLFAERASQRGEGLTQLGLRHWLRREKFAIDIAWQQRNQAGERGTGWVAGIGWYDL